MRKVLSLTQDESLRARERHITSGIPLVTTYNPRTSYIAEVANRNWHFLQSKERLAHIFRERPIIAYRRSKSLCDILVSSKLTGRTPEGHTTSMGSCGPCNKPKCSWCVLINKTSTFTGTRRDGEVFDIFHTVTCQSTFVIYIIECRICRARQLSTCALIITGTMLREESTAVNYQNTFSTTTDLMTLAKTSQLRSLNKLNGVT